MKSSQISGSEPRKIACYASVALFVAAAAILLVVAAPKEANAAPTRSTSIALTSDEQRLVVVNREAGSVSIIQVKDANGNDVSIKLDEIGVGEEPRCVAVHPTNRAAYVTNAITGTVSVLDLVLGKEVEQIQVGTEPRGCALTPDGSLLYVANHTEGTVSILVIPSGNPLNPILDGAVQVGGRPWAIAITDKGTGNISDDTVFVTDAFAELNPDFSDPVFDGKGEGRDLGKQGVVHAFAVGNSNPAITKISLKPLADSGFKGQSDCAK
jgi:YVTN family beta-propeller protein